MNPYLIALLIGLASGAFPAWWITSTHYQGVIAKEHENQQKVVIQQQEQNRLALLAYAERIVKAGADHDKNTRTIRHLSRQLDGLRINFPTCPVSDPAEDGGDPDRAARLFSDAMDAEFAAFQKRAGEFIERCDTLNNDAIRANDAHR